MALPEWGVFKDVISQGGVEKMMDVMMEFNSGEACAEVDTPVGFEVKDDGIAVDFGMGEAQPGAMEDVGVGHKGSF
jgi:hypothetical protein